MTKTCAKPDEDQPAKKPYETPQLEEYGDIREIAQAIGHSGMQDGGGHSLKTQ
jgi:hypothetical protein